MLVRYEWMLLASIKVVPQIFNFCPSCLRTEVFVFLKKDEAGE